jgi:photosystem II stability/assembly factor-like uncharacterized protein
MAYKKVDNNGARNKQYGDTFEDEEVFQRRAEWYRQMRGDMFGSTLQQRRKEASTHAARISEAILPETEPWWVSDGPNNINGRIKSLAIHPTDGNILYAGGADGGVWKTTDGGISWASQMETELSMAIGALCIAPSNTNVVYAATGEDAPGWAPTYPGIGVYKTTDGGIDWDLLAPIDSERCSRVLVSPSNPDTVYVAGDKGIHKSINGGASWTNVRTDHISDAVMDPLNPDIIYAGVWNNGVYKTSDGGITWTLLSNGLPTLTATEWIKLAIGPPIFIAPTQYLVAKMGLDSGQMFKSTDAGKSWTSIPGTHQPASYNEWTNMVAVDPNNIDVIFAGGVGLERSSNGGTSFTGIGGTHSDHHMLVFSPTDSNICYMATDGGVFKSKDNGVTWTLMSTGLTSTQLYTIGVAQAPPFVIGGSTQDQGIIKSDGLTDWIDTGAGNEGGFFIVDLNNGNNIYATPWDTNLTRSTNGGTNWTIILTGLSTPPIPAPAVTHLAVQPGDSNTLLCTAANNVFKSTDQGDNWMSALTTVGNTTYVAFSPENPTHCYAATDNGHVYRSTDSGNSGTWNEPYSPADKPPVGRITCIAISDTTLYVSYAQFSSPVKHVYRSVDNGEHWNNASGVLSSDSLPDVPVSALVIDQQNQEVVYASTEIGIFRTRNGGDSWESFSNGMPRIVTSGLTLRKSTNTLYASTMGRGVYRRKLSVLWWTPNVKIPSQLSKSSPALAAFQGKLHMVHLDDSSNEIWHSVFDGSAWTPNVKIPSQLSKSSPALAAFQGKLHMVHLDDSSNEIWHSEYDGQTWIPNLRIPDQQSKSSPALAAFQGKLHMVHLGDSSNDIWHSVGTAVP